MKIYLVDQSRKMKKISRALENTGIENIELKENLKFKMTKNDYIVTSDEIKLEGLEKLKNIIILVQEKNYKYIWNLANNYKTIDIIDINMPEEYIVKRINKVMGRE